MVGFQIAFCRTNLNNQPMNKRKTAAEANWRWRNTRIILQLALAVVLSTCGSGCCTYLLVDSTRYTTKDTFNPSAVYQTTNLQKVALEGTRFKDSSEQGQANASHVFIIMPKDKLVPANLRDNSTFSIDDIQTLQPGLIKGLKTESQLPASFKKVADLPPNNASVVLKEHHPRRIRYVFVPITAAVDVATAPLQIIALGYFYLLAKSN